MFVNILKSIAWVAFYFIASFIGSIVALLGKIFVFGVDWPTDVENVDAWVDAIVQLVLDTAVPGLIIAAIICIIVFSLFNEA